MQKRDHIRDMILEGNSYREIAAKLNVAFSTISYHAKILNKNKFTFTRRKHDWQAIQDYYNAGYTIKEIQSQFDIEYAVIYEARKNGKLHFAQINCPERKKWVKQTRILSGRGKYIMTSEIALVENSSVSRSVVKRLVKEDNLLEYHCYNTSCSLHNIENPTWAGKHLVLHLDHKNGIRNDHRIGNLRWLCPNCHSQTDTYSGRNLKRYR